MGVGLEHGIVLLSKYAIMGWLHIVDCPCSHNILDFFHFVLNFDWRIWLTTLTATDIVVENIAQEPLGIIQCDVVVYLGYVSVHRNVT